MSNLLEFQPSSKEDKQLWYVELLEGQIEKADSSIKELIDFTDKISVDISGNLMSVGQYKGAAMELAKNTKEVANEIENIKSVCILVKTDLVEQKNKNTNNDYKERAYLAEALKRKLEEEILKIKMENSYKVAELEEFLKCLEEENKQIKDYQETQENKKSELQKEINKANTLKAKLELELKNNQEALNSLEKANNELVENKESLIKKIEKFQKDQKNKLAEVQEQITGKDKLVLEIQKQNKILLEEKNKTQQETLALKKQNKELKNDLENYQENKEVDKELNMIKRIFEDFKIDSKKAADCFKQEIEQLLQVISELEDKYKVVRGKYHKLKSHLNNKSKTKDDDIDLLKHNFNAQIMTIKNESKEKFKEMAGQISDLQGLLKEKTAELDVESRKNSENEEKYKKIVAVESESQRKISVLEEKLKNQAVSSEQERNKLIRDLERSKTEHEKLILRLQENFTSAEILTDFITKSEHEKKTLDQSYKSELHLLQKKEKEKEAQMDQFRRKTGDLQEKLKDYEKVSSELLNLTKENEEQKNRINELSNQKAQQRSKIKDLEFKIRELEEKLEITDQKNLEKLEEIRLEIHKSYEEFEKTISKYEGQLEGLKEQYLLELRRLKGAKKSAETFDSIFQISKRDGMIKALKNELKLKSAKTEKKTATTPEILLLQTQNFKLKAIIKNLEHQLVLIKDEANKLREEIDMNIQINEDIRDKNFYSKKEISDLEKKHKIEMQTLLEEYNKLLHKKN